MVFGKQAVWVGTLAMMLAGVGVALHAQSGSSAQTGATGSTGAQNIPDAPQVPDAPRPQTLQKLNTITPVAPAMPDAPPPQAAPAATDQPAVGSTLPSAPTATPTAEDADQGAPPEEHITATIRVPVNFVQVPFTVKDSHNVLVPGLTYRDVRIYENGQRQQMRVFTVDPFPLSVALVIDQSVTYDTMTKINNALGALQGAFAPYDEISVFTYNNGVKEQTPPLAAQSARLGAIVERSKGKGREPYMGGGGPLDQTLIKNNQIIDPNTTAVRGQQGITLTTPKEFHTLNDAILAAAEEVAHAAKGRRRIVYVISDGKEYGSKASEKEVIRYCQRNKIAVYATLVGDSAVYGMGFIDRIHIPLTMRDDALPHYTAATGGEFDAEFRQKGIETSFAKIAEEVRTQYTVGYYSHEPMIDGKFRKIEVRVMRPNLTVISEDGYYPTAADSRPTPTTPTAVP